MIAPVTPLHIQGNRFMQTGKPDFSFITDDSRCTFLRDNGAERYRLAVEKQRDKRTLPHSCIKVR